MYDFEDRWIKVIDLESYRQGAYVNTVGRLPGSTRYMSPEEHTRNATIDRRTTVFNLGRHLRPVSVRALQDAWRKSVCPSATPDAD